MGKDRSCQDLHPIPTEKTARKSWLPNLKRLESDLTKNPMIYSWHIKKVVHYHAFTVKTPNFSGDIADILDILIRKSWTSVVTFKNAMLCLIRIFEGSKMRQGKIEDLELSWLYNLLIWLDCPNNFNVPFTILLTKHVLMRFLHTTLHHTAIMFNTILSNSNSNQVIEEFDIPICSSEKTDARTIQHAINLNLGKQVCHSGNCRLQWGNCSSHWSCKIQ